MGRPQFENQTEITAMSNKTVHSIVLDETNPVLTGWDNRRVVTIYSPDKTISRIMNMDLIWYPVAEAGAVNEKTVFVDNQLDAITGLGILEVTGAFGAETRFGTGVFTNHLRSKPTSDAAAVTNFSQARFDDTIGLSFVWFNNTGVTTSSRRRAILFVEREVIER